MLLAGHAPSPSLRSISAPWSGCACIARGTQFSFAKSFKVLKFVFLVHPGARSALTEQQPNTHVKHNFVRTSVFSSVLLFRCLLLSCLKWPAGLRVQESGQKKTCLLSLRLPPKMPQALREWCFSAKVNLVEVLWPPPDYSRWHQALQAKQRYLGKITPLKLPAEELNLTPTNCCTIVTGINGIC